MGILDAIMQSAVAGALRDTQDWLARQARGDGTDGGSLGNPIQRLAQEGDALRQGNTTLPLVGQVHYGALPGVLSVPLRVPAALDDLAGMTGEALGKLVAQPLGGGVPAALTGAQQAGYYALHPGETPSADDANYIAAFNAAKAGHLGRAADIARQDHPVITGAGEMAASFLPGQEVALPEELAMSAPRLAALVDAVNAVSKASVRPFEVAPVLHPVEATGIPTLQRALGADNALAGAINTGGAADAGYIPRLGPALPPEYGPAVPTSFRAPGKLPNDLTIPGIGRNGGRGIGPVLLPSQDIPLPPELGPTFPERGNLPPDWLLPGVGRNGGKGIGPVLPPGMDVPLPPELGPALPTRGNLPPDQLLPSIGRNGGRGIGPELPPTQGPAMPPLPPGIQSLADLLNAGRQTAQPNPLEQLLGAAQNVAGRDVAPRQTLGQIEAAVPRGVQTPAQAVLPLSGAHVQPAAFPGMVTPAEELAAKEAALAPNVSVPQPPATPPDFPALAGSRTDLLAGLSRNDLARLVSTAYDDQPNAIHNAFKARPDPVALAERAIERITTDGKLSAKRTALLQQRDPHLAEWVAALPDQAAQASADMPPAFTDPAARADGVTAVRQGKATIYALPDVTGSELQVVDRVDGRRAVATFLVPPEAQRQGHGTALMLAALRDGPIATESSGGVSAAYRGVQQALARRGLARVVSDDTGTTMLELAPKGGDLASPPAPWMQTLSEFAANDRHRFSGANIDPASVALTEGVPGLIDTAATAPQRAAAMTDLAALPPPTLVLGRDGRFQVGDGNARVLAHRAAGQPIKDVFLEATPAEAPALHRLLVERALQEGKPVPANVLKDYPDLAGGGGTGELRPDLGPQADDLIKGIEDAVARGNVDEANYLVATAADYGVPVSRAQAALNAAADAGGANPGVEAQRATIEQSPYFQVFKYFNRDGTLRKVNPTTGEKLVLRDNGKIVRGADEVWNLPGSGYDEVAAAALASPEFGHNQNFGQTSDDFWRNAQAAFRQYQALKRPGAEFGGDLAAGGGGFGIQPLAPAMQAAITNPHVLGGLAGATAGGAAGFAQGDDPNSPNFWRDVALGGVAGAGLGPYATQAPGAAAALAPHLAGKPAALRAIARDAWEQQRAAQQFRGQAPALVASIRALRTTSAGVPFRNLFNNMGVLALAGGATPSEYAATVSQMFDRMPQYLAALKAAGNSTQAQERAILEVLPDAGQQLRRQIQRQALAGGGTAADGDAALFAQLQKLGEDYQHTINPGARVSTTRGAALGVGGTLMGPGAVTGPIGLGLGLVRGALLPGRARLQSDLLVPIDRGGRFAIALPAMREALANGASLDQAGDLAAQKVSRAFADYHNPDAVAKALDFIAPGSRWGYEQSKIMAPLLAEHPQLATAAALAASHGIYPRADRANPGNSGTLQFDDQTKGIGLLARALNGGAAGQVNVDPLYDISPVGGSILNLPYGKLNTQRYPLATPWERAIAGLGAVGAPLNPLLQMALSKVGAIDQAPSNPDRLGNLGRAADIALGSPQWPTLAPIFKPGETGLPEMAEVLAGRVHDPAVDQAANEIAYEQTGKALVDPGNQALLQQTFDPHSPLMQAAKVRAGKQLAAQALASDLSPTPVDATTASARQAAVAEEALRAAGVAPDQVRAIAAASHDGLAGAQAQMLADVATAGYPAARLYAGMSAKERGTLLLDWWQNAHSVLAAVAPNVFQQYAQIEGEKYGLVPSGTLAQAQHRYDQQVLGLAPVTGGAAFYPPAGVTYADQLLRSPASSFPLPPGAGR